MPVRTELNLRLPNSPGALARVCSLLAAERVNILALALESSGQLRMVVDNHVRATGVLREAHYPLAARDVLVVSAPQAPGGLAPLLRLAADAGVNVEYAYASAFSGAAESFGAPPAAVVLGVTDAARAAAQSGL